jgi:hypothetical protein
MRFTVVDRGASSPSSPTADACVPRRRQWCESGWSPREAGSRLILVECSGWIEYLADRPLAAFVPYIEGREPRLLSLSEVCEVYKIIRRDLWALEAVSALRRATIVALDKSMALEAANVSLAPGLAMADAIVCATARRNAPRW